MLAEQGVISSDDALAIDEGLAEIKASIDAGDFEFDINNEDIHMSVESVLTEKIGDAGARLHTGRSRNDQVATDTRLFCKKRCTELMEANIALRHALIEQAEAHFNVILPGYTHLQHAQPVLFSHHMLAYVWMLTRDYERLFPCRLPRGRCEPARLRRARRHHLSARSLQNHEDLRVRSSHPQLA